MKACMSRPLSMALACLVAVLAGPGFALAKTEIQLWHGMTGVQGETLEAQADAIQRQPGRIRGQAGPQGQPRRRRSGRDGGSH